MKHLQLDDHSQIHFTWVRPGLLTVQVWKPGNGRDGHGWLLHGSTILSGQDLATFLAAVTPAEEAEAA